jgi:predicted permease
VLGRTRDGLGTDDVRRELAAIAADLASQHPGTNRGWSVTVRPLIETVVSPEFRRSVTLLAGAVAFVLLMACANVTGLLLTRATARRREMAIRTALGASQGSLVRLLLVESLVLAGAAGFAGVLLAWWAVDALKGLGFEGVPRLDDVTLGLPVLAFAVLITILTAAIFGTVPALQASRLPGDALRSRESTADARASRGRSVLIVVEAALAVLLLVGAGLMIRSFVRLQERHLGFDPGGLLVAHLAVPPDGAEAANRTAATDALLTELGALPGVASVAGGSSLPFAGSNSGNIFEIEGNPPPDDQPPDTDTRVVTAGYFRTLGIPVLRGRTFTAADGLDAPAVIVSATAARRYWRDREPIGARVRFGGSSAWATVVGIADDARYLELDEPDVGVRPMMYVPHRQAPATPLTIALKTHVAPDSLVPGVRTALAASAPDRPVVRIETMEAILSRVRGPQWFATTLLTLFAWVAVVLAAAGLYGLIAYAVSRRVKEIGVRIALGATRFDIIRLVAGRGLALGALGVGFGMLGALWMTALMRRILFGISPTDPATYALVAVGFLAVAGLASYLPARRALQVKPLDALKAD